MRLSTRRALPAASALLPLLALAACGDNGNSFPPACPQVLGLPDAGDLIVSRNNSPDITDLALHARFEGFFGDCTWGKPGQVISEVRVRLRFDLGPAATGRVVQVPYWIAVLSNGQVVQKRDFVARAAFPPNTDQARFASDPIDIILPVTAQKSAAAYTLVAGLQLTPEQLAFIRAHPQP